MGTSFADLIFWTLLVFLLLGVKFVFLQVAGPGGFCACQPVGTATCACGGASAPPTSGHHRLCLTVAHLGLT